MKTQTKRRETRLINTFSSNSVVERIVLFGGGVKPSNDGCFSSVARTKFTIFDFGTITICHPELDSGSSQYGHTDIDRFCVVVCNDDIGSTTTPALLPKEGVKESGGYKSLLNQFCSIFSSRRGGYKKCLA